MSTEKKGIGTGKKMTLHWAFYWASTGQKKKYALVNNYYALSQKSYGMGTEKSIIGTGIVKYKK